MNDNKKNTSRSSKSKDPRVSSVNVRVEITEIRESEGSKMKSSSKSRNPSTNKQKSAVKSRSASKGKISDGKKRTVVQEINQKNFQLKRKSFKRRAAN